MAKKGKEKNAGKFIIDIPEIKESKKEKKSKESKKEKGENVMSKKEEKKNMKGINEIDDKDGKLMIEFISELIKPLMNELKSNITSDKLESKKSEGGKNKEIQMSKHHSMALTYVRDELGFRPSDSELRKFSKKSPDNLSDACKSLMKILYKTDDEKLNKSLSNMIENYGDVNDEDKIFLLNQALKNFKKIPSVYKY
jgi:hypothetical protein